MGVLDVARQGRFSKMPEPPIVLVPHDPVGLARAAIMAACGGCVLEMLHVGSNGDSPRLPSSPWST